jgi:ubiquinol-cytochrome c reductase iron-sulfur subunit
MVTQHAIDPNRRRLVVATSVVGGAGIVASAVPFVASLTPSDRARAAGAPVEADFTRLEAGGLLTVEWRGKPVWILHRTPDMIARLGQIRDRLADPDSQRSQQPDYARNPLRSRKPEYLIVEALCTHLGCVPSFRPDVAPRDLGPAWPGGFYCPCHGSMFDLAGRVYRNVPAPVNLVVPPYHYKAENQVVIGLHSEAG